MFVYPYNSYDETLITSVIWRQGLGEVIKVRWNHEDGALIMGLVFL